MKGVNNRILPYFLIRKEFSLGNILKVVLMSSFIRKEVVRFKFTYQMEVVVHPPSAEYRQMIFWVSSNQKGFLRSQQQQQCVPNLDLSHIWPPNRQNHRGKLLATWKLKQKEKRSYNMKMFNMETCLGKWGRCNWACNLRCFSFITCTSYSDLHDWFVKEFQWYIATVTSLLHTSTNCN